MILYGNNRERDYRVGRDAVIRNSVVMGADYYETQQERKDDSDCGVGCISGRRLPATVQVKAD